MSFLKQSGGTSRIDVSRISGKAVVYVRARAGAWGGASIELRRVIRATDESVLALSAFSSPKTYSADTLDAAFDVSDEAELAFVVTTAGSPASVLIDWWVYARDD